MRRYHLILADHTERDVRATGVEVLPDGTLRLSNNNETVMLYAPGTWRMCEVERVDDKA